MGTKSTTRYGVFPFLGIALLIMAESGCVNQTTQSQSLFWWNWWLHLAVAVGTIGAVLVALFGQAFRAKFFPPKLSLRLENTSGEAIQESAWKARYYHLIVSNSRRWSPAHEVRVVLLREEEPGPNEDLQVIWTGNVPLIWKNQPVHPLLRTIGPTAWADLCSVKEREILRIHPMIRPNNLTVTWKKRATIVLTVQAQATEGESQPLKIRIAWDGEWERGEAEMKRHLMVEEFRN
jgi:hypothetical protein